ncbi:sensor histidine kinase [Paenibacillus sp. CF384]|uniref:sensor histidine kinase n=1 Tax=Paenibacillus sp. CF384 TaxID=1884382 RepID=UPI000897D025|nr:sensor histidine kinase [Paenibacillus sp. CF384]SDX45440.1 two-component system, sensor histidine kinase YesM [Paenibacillus sp. CF384]
MNVLRKLPIRGQMFLIAALTMGMIIAILLFNYSRSAAFLTKNNEVYTNDMFSQIEQTILSNYDVVKWLTYNVAYNKSIQDYLLDEDPLSKLQRYPTLRNLFINLSTVKPGILDFLIIGKNGETFSLQGSTLSQFNVKMPKKADSYFSAIQTCKNIGLERYCFAVGTNIFSSDIHNNYTNEIGQIILLIDATTLTGGYDIKSLQPGTSVYLLDRNNTIFMSNARDKIGQPFHLPSDEADNGIVQVDGKLQHIQVKELPQIGGKFVRLIPDDVFFKDIRKLRKQTMIALGIGILLMIIPFVLILNNMILPLRKLYHYMRIHHKDDLNKRLDLQGSTEAEVIGIRYNQMLSDVQDLTEQLVDSNERLLKSEIEKKRAEFDFLKSQVNPHFLYNTLDTIRGLASERGVPEIREMTGALSRIFRYSIKGQDTVLLSDEIRIAEAYMNIQMIRFSNRFTFQCDIPESLRSAVVPKMILQPLVENAVYHGLEPRYEQGKLTITAHYDLNSGHDLIVTVSDDGVGIDEKRLARLRYQLHSDRQVKPDAAKSAGVGLMNVHHRLQFHYGHDYGLDIWSKENRGTVVTIRIPVQMEGGANPV